MQLRACASALGAGRASCSAARAQPRQPAAPAPAARRLSPTQRSLALRRDARAAAFTTGRPQPANSAPSPDQLAKELDKLLELVRDVTEIAVATGPRGAFRAFQGVEAVAAVGQELLAQGPNAKPPSAPVVLRKLFERLGATYVKLGQFIASSPTLFPEEFVLEFQQCLDKTPSIPFDTVKGIIEAELGKPISAVFESVDPVPLASASIAQVHVAILKESRKEVVLKVLKPSVQDQLTVDLNFLYIATRVLEYIQPELARTSLAGIMGDIRNSMMDEVDFTKESRNMAAFSAYLSTAGITDAVVPFVYNALSSKRLLVMERLRGVALTDLETIRRYSRGDPEMTLISALNTWLGSVLACESFHADVHAGNLLVLPDGKVGFIDFGIVGRISPGTWGAVQTLLRASAIGDYRLMARALVQMGATAPAEEVDIESFARDLEAIYSSINELEPSVVVSADQSVPGSGRMAAAVSVNEADINRLLLDVIRVGETHGIRFPREFGLLLKQLLYFDRYTRLLAPELQMFNDQRVRMSS